MYMNSTLNRTTFTTSRKLDFCTEDELVKQIGHDTHLWPIVVLKELLDNALDACEEAKVAPIVKVVVNADGITVTDNGPGIPAKTIDGVLDYNVRISSREAYVSPTRGAQGNALMTLVAMPYVLSEEDKRGQVDITTGGDRHEIVFSVNHIRQDVDIDRKAHPAPNVKNGTVFTVHMPVASLLAMCVPWERTVFTIGLRFHLPEPPFDTDGRLARGGDHDQGHQSSVEEIPPL